MQTSRLAILAMGPLMLFACTPEPELLTTVVHSEVDLVETLSSTVPQLTSITIEPETERVLLFDSNLGLLELDEEWTATSVFDTGELVTEFPGLFSPNLLFSSVVLVALGEERFGVLSNMSLTVALPHGDGVRSLDLGSDLPLRADAVGNPRARSLAYDSDLDRLYVPTETPVMGTPSLLIDITTVDPSLDDPNLQEATSSEEIPADSLFSAAPEATAILPDGSLLLSVDAVFHRFTPDEEGGELSLLGILPDVQSIDGLVVRPSDGHLLVVDGDRDLLLELEVEGL